jgi:hypothetical protein
MSMAEDLKFKFKIFISVLFKIYGCFNSLHSSLDKIIFSNKLYNSFHPILEFGFVFDVHVKCID